MNTLSKTINRCVLTIGTVFFVSSCSSTSTVNTVPASNIMTLTSKYAVLEDKGPGPVDIDIDHTLARYMFYRQGMSQEYLLVLFPEHAAGDIKIELEGDDIERTPASFRMYFDMILRAHRLLLKGEIKAAKVLVDRIEDRYDTGFGSSIIAANIALVSGDKKEARRLFKLAMDLLPNNKEISIIGKLKEK